MSESPVPTPLQGLADYLRSRAQFVAEHELSVRMNGWADEVEALALPAAPDEPTTSFDQWGRDVKFWYHKMVAAFSQSIADGSCYEYGSFDAGYTAGMSDALQVGRAAPSPQEAARPSGAAGDEVLPVAWMKRDFIYEDGTGRPIGMDEPEFYWDKEPPEENAGWLPLYAPHLPAPPVKDFLTTAQPEQVGVASPGVPALVPQDAVLAFIDDAISHGLDNELEPRNRLQGMIARAENFKRSLS
jgi:hypothetical protein